LKSYRQSFTWIATARRPVKVVWGLLLVSMLLCSSRVFAQSTNAVASISRTGPNVLIGWTGQWTLQSASGVSGPWQDLLEAPHPLTQPATNSQQWFRIINRWSTRATLPEANSELSVAELQGKIYLFGGYPANRITVATVQVYDSTLNQWYLTTPLPLAVNHSMAAAANGKLYVIGGQTDANTAYTNTVFEFNPANSNWTTKASMPTARSAGGAAVIGNLIYVAGGRPPRGQDFAVYNVLNNQWTTLTNLPTGRNHLVAAAINDKVYVAGGRLAGGFTSAMTNVLEVFDPATGTWTTKAPMLQPRGGINGIAANGNLFVWGGEGPDGVFSDHDMYVPSLDGWYHLQSLPIAVHGVTGAAFINGWIHAPGGGTAQGGSSGSTLHQVFWVPGIGP
jgi:N-acetylneuraminic acid mutarotase